MNSIIISIMIIIGIFLINKKIDNKDLNKQIIILGILLLLWIITRTIKYSFVSNNTIKRYLWYFYYFSILYSSTIFLSIGTWHNKNKKHIKIIKTLSFIINTLLFLFVMTNDFHKLVFIFNLNDPNLESTYTYGFLYYVCFLWIFINIFISIYSTIRYSKSLYKKQKSIILAIIFFIVLMYAIGFIIKVNIVSNYFKDFTLIYCSCYLLALIIIVYKEKYRLAIEDNLYSEIEEAIKDKTIIISQIINNISKSKNKKRDLSYIKLLVSYCKRKSNLIVIQKNVGNYSSRELNLFINNAFIDVKKSCITGTVNIINNFEIPIYIASIIYSYIYSIFEYSLNYTSTNILIVVERVNNIIKLNTSINTNEDIKTLIFNFEENKYITNNIKIAKEDNNNLNIKLELPLNNINIIDNNLSAKEKNAVLQIKSKVHDILGQRLSLLSCIIDEEKIDIEKINEIKPLLSNILNDLNNDKYIAPNLMLNQLIYSCEIAGVNLYVMGDLPKNYLKANTIVKIIRECSTNAIRHAKAKNIYVTIKKENNSIKIIITNDGNIPHFFIEGDGIKGIKLRVEELKGKIEISPFDKFTITITI